MDNNCYIPDLVQAFYYCIASLTSNLYDSRNKLHYIDNDA